jgi:hypothetical protein
MFLYKKIDVFLHLLKKSNITKNMQINACFKYKNLNLVL